MCIRDSSCTIQESQPDYINVHIWRTLFVETEVIVFKYLQGHSEQVREVILRKSFSFIRQVGMDMRSDVLQYHLCSCSPRVCGSYTLWH